MRRGKGVSLRDSDLEPSPFDSVKNWAERPSVYNFRTFEPALILVFRTTSHPEVGRCVASPMDRWFVAAAAAPAEARHTDLGLREGLLRAALNIGF